MVVDLIPLSQLPSCYGMRKRGEIAWAIDKQTSDWSESLPSSTKSVKETFSEAFDFLGGDT